VIYLANKVNYFYTNERKASSEGCFSFTRWNGGICSMSICPVQHYVFTPPLSCL